ncbi:MAG: hypothetical protein DHS20C16_27100 [Phycisphaerae bacterium]|nr:MAG: hypothetical protein DHS20C16_27100 [Phycisphaerae bacterium]
MGIMRIVYAGIIVIFTSASLVHAAITESQTLVVYNSASSEGVALKDAYLAAHPGIPSEPFANVIDLNDASLLKSDLTIDEFITKVRDPIRHRLLLLIPPRPNDIIAIVLIRPMPHRILDSDNPLVGDDPSAADVEFFDNADATYASVDSELTLLFQDLYTGEVGGTMDSLADNVILNPYWLPPDHLVEIDAFSRLSIISPKTFENRYDEHWQATGSGSSRLTSGDIYLVCRIDGTTQADALALIDRAQDLSVNRATTHVLLDTSAAYSGLFNEYLEFSESVLSGAGWNVRFDESINFIDSSEEPRPLIAYASSGEDHGNDGQGEDPPGDGTYIDGFTFAQGAIFTSAESYNARGLNGLGTLFDQEQVADFVSVGGTFAIGNVFEQFAYGWPEAPYYFYHMFVNQWTWAEAAYTSIPFLSGQTIVLGDPLARFETIVDIEGDCNADISVDIADYSSFATCLAQSPTGLGLECECFDFNTDTAVDLADFAELQVFFDDN